MGKEGQQSSMTVERIAALNNLGFDWVLVKQTAWEIRLEELQEFHQTNGHCRVPFKYPQNESLGKWVSTMQTEFKKRKEGQQSRLTDERIAALNNLGFDGSLVKDTAWEVRLEELQEFHQTNGHCRVPWNYSKNPSLGK